MDSCLGRLNKFMLQSDSAMSPVESEADFHDDDVDAGTFLFHDDDDVDAGTNSDWPNGAGAEPGNLRKSHRARSSLPLLHHFGSHCIWICP